MAMTVRDILMNADAFRRAYPHWPHAEPFANLPSRLAAWLTAEGISSAETSPDLAERLITALGETKAEAHLGDGTGSQALTEAAKGIAALAVLGDAGWSAEDYWHGHRERRPR